MNEIVLNLAYNYVLPALGSLILALGAYTVRLLNKKLGNDQVKQALDQLSTTTKVTVQSLNQTIVPTMRNALGELGEQEKDSIKNTAITLVKAQMQDDFLSLLSKNSIDVDKRIDSEIESQVFLATRDTQCKGVL